MRLLLVLTDIPQRDAIQDQLQGDPVQRHRITPGRGLNEHANGLVREYFPKGTDLSRVTAREVQQVEDQLNHRPRKVLGYRTPFEVFHAGLSCCTS